MRSTLTPHAGTWCLPLLFAVALGASADVAGAHAPPTRLSPVVPESSAVAELPLLERPSEGGDSTLAILLTGDGGFAPGDEAMTAALNQRGIAVVALDSRRYLQAPRTPQSASQDLGRVLRHYGDAWGRRRALIIGYSRGADLAPFMVARLPQDLRARIAKVALLGPGPAANFRFHWIDLVKTVKRPDDLPLRPELAKLRGIPIVCVYGAEDRDAICPTLDPSIARVVRRDGGHRIAGSEGADVVAYILEAQ